MWNYTLAAQVKWQTDFTKYCKAALYTSVIQKIPGRPSSTVSLSWRCCFQPAAWSSETGQRLCLQLPFSSVSCPIYGSCRVQLLSLCVCVCLWKCCPFLWEDFSVWQSALPSKTSLYYTDWQQNHQLLGFSLKAQVDHDQGQVHTDSHTDP